MSIHIKKIFRYIYLLLSACLLLSIVSSGCGYTHPAENSREQNEEKYHDEVNNYQPEGDSVYLPGYYYSFVFDDKYDKSTAPEWILGNLEHFNIEYQDAWYTYSTSPYLHNEETFITKTVYPPAMIVRLNPNDPSVLEHHFQKCKPVPKRKFKVGWMHYSFTKE